MKLVHVSAPIQPSAPPPAGPCAHLGEPLRTEICQFCGKRKKLVAVHECSIWGTCSLRPYRAGQPEQSCAGCKQYESTTMPPGHLPEIPPGFPPPPADLTPLPAGRDTFNGDEWKRLPKAHQQYYRDLKRYRDRGEPPPQAVAATNLAYEIPRDKTPFSDVLGRPVFLNNFGQGSSAFLILGGPSLRTLDLSQLSRRGIFSMAVNNSAGLVRPNAWISVDTPSKFCSAIWKDPAVIKFVNNRFLGKELRERLADGKFGPMKGSDGKTMLVRDCPSTVGISRNANFDPVNWLQEPSINWGHSKKSFARNRGKHPQVLNSMFAAVKTLYAMNFKVIYLLGCDFSMSAESPYAFPQAKSAGGVSSNNNTYRKLSEMFGELVPHFARAGLHIFNCNKTSGLTVFPYVDFETAIRTATLGVEQGVLNTEGWYAVGGAGD